MKKQVLRKVTAIGLILTMMVFLLPGFAGAESWKLEDARSMLTLINSFRTGGSWYWNQDNTTWTTVSGLGSLSYDYELEKVAMVRAQEQAQRFGHDRPDGSKWSTAFPSGNYYKGENIAMGFATAAEAFEALKEENEDYSGQGHRRNMLKREFTRVGIAGVVIGGDIYWVQEFASGAVASSSPQQGTGSAAAATSAAGWAEYGGQYYYQNADGSWATGWLQDGGAWYYLNGSGAMVTGWQQISGTWYYFGSSGAMGTGWQKIGGGWYHFTGSGMLDTGWFADDGAWYYANSSGAILTGWQEIGGAWYYFHSSGAMATGTVTIDGQREIFGSDGIWQGTEISGYDTPLGGSDLVQLIRKVFMIISEIVFGET